MNYLFVCLFVWDPQPHFSRGVNSRRRTYGPTLRILNKQTKLVTSIILISLNWPRNSNNHENMLLLYVFIQDYLIARTKCELFVCLFVCLGSATAFFPRGQLPKEDLRRPPSTTQATRHPRALCQCLFPLPPYFCLECLLHPVCTLPCPPVLYIYPIESLVCFPVLHI